MTWVERACPDRPSTKTRPSLALPLSSPLRIPCSDPKTTMAAWVSNLSTLRQLEKAIREDKDIGRVLIGGEGKGRVGGKKTGPGLGATWNWNWTWNHGCSLSIGKFQLTEITACWELGFGLAIRGFGQLASLSSVFRPNPDSSLFSNYQLCHVLSYYSSWNCLLQCQSRNYRGLTQKLPLVVDSRSKIVKANGAAPDELENQVNSYIVDLESTSELKADLKTITFTGAKEVCSGWQSDTDGYWFYWTGQDGV